MDHDKLVPVLLIWFYDFPEQTLACESPIG